MLFCLSHPLTTQTDIHHLVRRLRLGSHDRQRRHEPRPYAIA